MHHRSPVSTPSASRALVALSLAFLIVTPALVPPAFGADGDPPADRVVSDPVLVPMLRGMQPTERTQMLKSVGLSAAPPPPTLTTSCAGLGTMFRV